VFSLVFSDVDFLCIIHVNRKFVIQYADYNISSKSINLLILVKIFPEISVQVTTEDEMYNREAIR